MQLVMLQINLTSPFIALNFFLILPTRSWESEDSEDHHPPESHAETRNGIPNALVELMPMEEGESIPFRRVQSDIGSSTSQLSSIGRNYPMRRPIVDRTTPSLSMSSIEDDIRTAMEEEPEVKRPIETPQSVKPEEDAVKPEEDAAASEKTTSNS